MKAIKHFRNVCLGVCLIAASVYYGGVPGFVLGALGIALIIGSGGIATNFMGRVNIGRPPRSS